jgi:hypothetical protein
MRKLTAYVRRTNFLNANMLPIVSVNLLRVYKTTKRTFGFLISRKNSAKGVAQEEKKFFPIEFQTVWIKHSNILSIH